MSHFDASTKFVWISDRATEGSGETIVGIDHVPIHREAAASKDYGFGCTKILLLSVAGNFCADNPTGLVADKSFRIGAVNNLNSLGFNRFLHRFEDALAASISGRVSSRCRHGDIAIRRLKLIA